MRPFGRLLPLETARRRLLAAVRPLDRTDTIPLLEAVGRVAARRYTAPAAVPSFSRATWDGYALRSADTARASAASPLRLRVIGEIFAEDSLGRPLRAGECAAIATGGALPRGADAVVMFEVVREGEREITIERPVRRGDRIATAGEDLPRGHPVVRKDDVLTPAVLGGLAATGRESVEVWARPLVTVIPNGNELVAPGRPLGRGQIYETNNLTLSGVVRAMGGTARTTPPVPDDPERIEAAIRGALEESDLVLVTGGSSVGERDFLPTIFPRLGRLLFHGIAVRPGKPTLAVAAGKTVVLGMPGHPTSCLSNGFWLLLPTLRKLGHLPGPGWTDVPVKLAEPQDAPSKGMATVVPLRVEDGWARSTFHGSSAITSLNGANAFAILGPGGHSRRRGARVTAHLLPTPVAVAPVSA
jgi:molybdopterin molybdotransferase